MVGKFVEFFGLGVSELTLADRATISNMCPEYGATTAFFPVDDAATAYLRQTGSVNTGLAAATAYLRHTGQHQHRTSRRHCLLQADRSA